MAKKVKKTKLQEDEQLQDMNAAPAPAVPATDAEVAAAAPAPVAPAADMSAPMDMEPAAPSAPAPAAPAIPEGTDVGTGEVALNDTPAAAGETPETYTAPLPGYVPSGWTRKDSLSVENVDIVKDEIKNELKAELQGQVADTMETGDPAAIDYENQQNLENELADAPEALPASGEPLVAEEAAPMEEAPMEEPADEGAPVLESLKLTNEEIKLILEYRKLRKGKLVEAENPAAEVAEEDTPEYLHDTEMAADAVEGLYGDLKDADGPAEVLDVTAGFLRNIFGDMGKEEAEEDEEESVDVSMLSEAMDDEEAEEKEVSEEDLDTDEFEDEVEEEAEEDENMEPAEGIFDDIDYEEEADEENFDDIFGDLSDDELLSKISDFLDDTDMTAEEAVDALDASTKLVASLLDDEEPADAPAEGGELSFDDIKVGTDVEEEVEEDAAKDAEEELEAEEDADDSADADLEAFFGDDDEDVISEIEAEAEEEAEAMTESQNSGIWYPAGSEPYEKQDNLVEAYKKVSARRREALKSYRDTMDRPVRESFRYGSALNSSMKVNNRMQESVPTDTNSWAYAKYMEKQEEGRLNYTDLLEKGYLG